MYTFVEELVETAKPLNLDFILGMDCMKAFRRATVHIPSDVRFGIDGFAFCSEVADEVTDYVIDEKHFTVTNEVATRKWTLSWE